MKMALYRCAACGSPNVVEDIQKEGYDYVKGAIGTVVLGVGGAVAGINGKTKKVYKCPDCGLTLSEPMSFETKTLIDIGVSAPSSRKNLQLLGVPIDWETLTHKYKNIENGSVDVLAEEVVSPSWESKPPCETQTTKQDMDEIELHKIVYKVAKANYTKECIQWAKDCQKVKREQDSQVEKLVGADIVHNKAKITSDRDTEVSKHFNQKNLYLEEKANAESRLSKLGLLHLGEKSKIKKDIESLEQLISREDSLLAEIQQSYEKEMKELERRDRLNRAKIRTKVESKYPFPSKPNKPQAMIDYCENGRNSSNCDITNHFVRDEIFRYIESCGNATFNKIKSNCPSVQDMTDQRIRGWIDTLIQKKEISKDSNNKYSVVYKKNPDWERKIDVTENDLRIYKAYIEEKERERIKKENENLTIDNVIITALKGVGPIKLEELLEREPNLKEYSNARIYYRLGQLAEKKRIKITEVMRCKYYEGK